jgi:membrane-bound lytic murein transglycosylase D
VNVRGGTRLARVARLASVPLKTLKELNPELLRSRVPPGLSYELRLPPSALPTYRRNAARASAGTRKLLVHRVRYGDSVSSIAAQYGVSARLLRQINQIRSQREVRPGVRLLVPDTGRRRPARQGRGNTPRALVAVTPDVPVPAGHEAVYYPVVAGDELTGIARALGVPLAELLAANGVTAAARLMPGMVLRAFVPTGKLPRGVRLLDARDVRVVAVNSVAFHTAHAQRHGQRRIVYRVRPGDTMPRIARRYGVSRGAIARYNKIYRNARLRPGTRLVLYVRGRQRRRWRRRRGRPHRRARPRTTRTRGRRAAAKRPHRP